VPTNVGRHQDQQKEIETPTEAVQNIQ